MPNILKIISDTVLQACKSIPKTAYTFVSKGSTVKILFVLILLLGGIFLFVTKDKKGDPDKNNIYNKILDWRSKQKYIGIQYTIAILLFSFFAFYLSTGFDRMGRRAGPAPGGIADTP